ncbi:transcriptional regulator [Ramlibacter sp.]|uniref:transcriptional regulator n=1 Tax=Ramlibacter sp. TaxID=1917967 RepID=UPI003D129270
MTKLLPPEERRKLADKVGVNEATLYQAMTGKGSGFKPAECVRIERDSEFRLRRWDLRPKDWWQNWPELIGAEGAPEVPTLPKPAAESTK